MRHKVGVPIGNMAIEPEDDMLYYTYFPDRFNDESHTVGRNFVEFDPTYGPVLFFVPVQDLRLNFTSPADSSFDTRYEAVLVILKEPQMNDVRAPHPRHLQLLANDPSLTKADRLDTFCQTHINVSLFIEPIRNFPAEKISKTPCMMAIYHDDRRRKKIPLSVYIALKRAF